MQHQVTVWFDSSCPLCIREIGLFRRLDKRSAINFVDVLSGQACPLDQATLLARFHAQEVGGEVVSGAAAFAAMWRAIPLLRPVGLLMRYPIILSSAEITYIVFLRLRPSLQRLVRKMGFE
jgi:predicted DCC family thiol-disulfide oxidoreductase YuxK